MRDLRCPCCGTEVSTNSRAELIECPLCEVEMDEATDG